MSQLAVMKSREKCDHGRAAPGEAAETQQGHGEKGCVGCRQHRHYEPLDTLV